MSVKVPTMYNDMYIGRMTEEQAELILATRKSGVIPNLEKMIFDFPNELVLKSLRECRSIRSMLKESGYDYSEYIGSLKGYQTVGSAFMYLSPRSMIGDGVGLGKTVEIAALLNFLRQRNEMKRFLIAVENSAWGQTTAELVRFTGMNVVQLPSEKSKLIRATSNIDWATVDGIVIKHSALRSDTFSKWLAMNLNEDGTSKVFDTFILDESSVIKNANTKTYEYTKNICDLAKRVHFMNATSFETNIMDIYYQFDMMNEELLPKKWHIEKEFCTYKTGTYWTKVNGKATMNFKRDLSGYKNQAIFKEGLKLVYFGRSIKDIGVDIPHTYKVYEVEPSTDQSLALAKGYRYNEVLNCPSLISDINVPTTRKTVPKLDRLLSLMENEFSDNKVMIFAFHLEAQKFIAEELKAIGRKPVILNGDCKDEERMGIQDGFNNGTYDVIITNIKKSLNLYGGEVCIFYSVLTNPAAMFQAAGRIDRVGRVSQEDIDNKNYDKYIKTFVLLLYKGTDEYKYFTDVVKQRAKDARDLTIDSKTTVDYFVEAMKEEETHSEES